MKVLVVDDEERNAKMIGIFLEKLGHTVDQALTAAEAIALIDKEGYEAILTDKNMPGGEHPDEGGLDILSYARRRSPTTQVLVMTGHATVESAIEAMRLGAFDYILKPFSMAELRGKMERLQDYLNFLAPESVCDLYRTIRDEFLDVVREGPRRNDEGEWTRRMQSFEQRLDLLFGDLRKREDVIAEQREALLRIAGLAAQLLEEKGTEGAVAKGIKAILRETERMV